MGGNSPEAGLASTGGALVCTQAKHPKGAAGIPSSRGMTHDPTNRETLVTKDQHTRKSGAKSLAEEYTHPTRRRVI